jgi:hypothetical protein
MQKAKALLKSGQSYETNIVLTRESKQELEWWCNELQIWNGRSMIRPSPDVVMNMTSDASKKGWGATCNGMKTQGVWSVKERSLHINVLEMKAAMFAVKSFTKQQKNIHVHIQVDNKTTVANINKMGNTKSTDLIQVTKEIWDYCLQNMIMITAEYLPGKLNTQADMESRKYTSNWRLDTQIFKQLNIRWGPIHIDLFADRLNAQLPQYASWKPDPLAAKTDAFTMKWTEGVMYIFPPFCLIGRCLSKIQLEEAEAVLITPIWGTQPWYAKILHMLIDYPVLIPKTSEVLTDPWGTMHPLIEQDKMILAAWRISGRNGEQKDFQKKLSKSWKTPAGQAQNPLTSQPGTSGFAGAWQGRWIPFMPLWQI